VLGSPKRCKLAHAFLWDHSHNRLKLAQVLGRRGVFLTWDAARTEGCVRSSLAQRAPADARGLL
jgi:hypothetical protein